MSTQEKNLSVNAPAEELSEENLSEQRQIRREKLKKLREMKDTASEEEVSDREGCDGVAQKPNGAVHRELARLRPGASSHCKISFRPLKVPLATHQCSGRPGS